MYKKKANQTIITIIVINKRVQGNQQRRTKKNQTTKKNKTKNINVLHMSKIKHV